VSRRSKIQHEMTVERAILKTAQGKLKDVGITTQLRTERGVTLLRYQSFVSGGQFELRTDGATTLNFRTNATTHRRSYFTKIFPDAANPDFDPDVVIALILEVSLHLQGVSRFFDTTNKARTVMGLPI